MKENNVNENLDNNTAENDILTFDEILADKFYQSEFDKRVTKALNTQAENLKKEYETKIGSLEEKVKLAEGQTTELDKLNEVLEQEKIKRAYEVTLAKTGVKDLVSLKAHTEQFLKEPELTEDGNIKGLEEFLNEKLNGELIHLKPTENKALGKPINNPPKNDEREEAIFKGFGLK